MSTILTSARRDQRIFLLLISLLTGLLFWHLLVRYLGVPTFILPRPSQVWGRLLQSLADGSLLVHAGVTL